jgi:TonB family protein
MPKGGKRKILRVGIIQSGRIVEERLIRKREDVTIGQSSKNTFILPAGQLRKSFTIFETKAGKYHLIYDESMEGRVSAGDGVLDLKELAKLPSTKKRGSRYTVELEEKSRGKIVIAEFTVLFQFIDAPPVLPRPQLPAAARGSISQSVEWLLVNILLVCGLILGGGGVYLDFWWQNTGQYLVVEFGKKTKAFEVLKAEVLAEKEEEEEEEPEPEAEEESDEDAAAEAEPVPQPKKKAPKKAAPKKEEKKPDANPRRSSRSRSEKMASVKKKTFLHVLGSVGDGEGGFGANTLKDGVATGKLADAFDDMGGVGIAEAGHSATFAGQPAAVKTGSGGYKGISRGDAGGGAIKTKKVKSSGRGASKEVRVRANTRGGKIGGKRGKGKMDTAGVQKVFKRRLRATKSCYEKALKRNENLRGKVVISFTIGAAGRITEIKVKKNTTGDASVGKCIIAKVKSWKFPRPEGGAVKFNFPFFLEKG